ncbi:MAG: S-layer homology domain-containing protein [Chroococcidiopsidaceae cyanobacterium CP_BM_ER_R8_30]|nr:S-layer homology domain-containing protein [Chroococcidiopsidaceae cyanobacterium CP_BM_ER_R8_30]
MSNFSSWLSRVAVFIALTITAGIFAPLSISALASAQRFAGGSLRADDKACGKPAGNVLENGGVDAIDPNRLDSRAQAQTNPVGEVELAQSSSRSFLRSQSRAEVPSVEKGARCGGPPRCSDSRRTGVLTFENSNQPTFSDVGSNWAGPFIQALAARNIISGYPDGSFRPARVVNRADFAAMLQKAFPNQKQVLSSTGSFVDVSANYWAAPAIRNAYTAGFMTGYPDGSFHPTKYISKAQAIVALAKGLGLSFTGSPAIVLNRYYKDAKAIPHYAANGIAAATQAHMVVNYPNVKVLAPNQVISRGEAAALIYQALVAQGVLPPLSAGTADANYIVGGIMERSGQ